MDVPFPAPTSSGGGVGSLLNPHQDSLPSFSFLKVTVLLWKAGRYITPRVPFTAAPATFLEAMWLLLPSRRYSHLTEEPEADLRVGELIQSCSYAERTKLILARQAKIRTQSFSSCFYWFHAVFSPL